MMRRVILLVAVVGLLVAVTAPALAGNGPSADRRVIVFVESQGLFYESIVGPNLPAKGPFQELRPGEGPGGELATEFGPGDPGYVGGRWWVDVNGNEEMDSDDMYFSCPLIGKGHASPP